MAEKKDASSRRVPEEKAASPNEIRAAIEALTEAQSERLEQYARSRIYRLGRKALGRNWQDLLQEAMTLTLAGDRHWNKSVTFVAHLLGAIRSTAWNWAKKFDEAEALLESEVVTQTSEGKSLNPMLNVRSTNPGPAHILSVKQQLDLVPPLLKDDPLALQVFEGLRARMNGPEIQEVLEITQAEFDAKVKKIYRRARPVLRQGGQDAGEA